jgi:hypothetical protein
MAFALAMLVSVGACAGPTKSRVTGAPSWRIVMPADTTRATGASRVSIVERLRDDRRDGRVEVLEIEAFVPVDSAGEYVLIKPELRDQAGRLIAVGRSPRRSAADTSLSSPSPLRFEADSLRIGLVRIAFDGAAIRQGGTDGPWIVRFGAAAVRAWARGSPEIADRRYEARTAQHRAADFGRDDPVLDAAPPRKE